MDRFPDQHSDCTQKSNHPQENPNTFTAARVTFKCAQCNGIRIPDSCLAYNESLLKTDFGGNDT